MIQVLEILEGGFSFQKTIEDVTGCNGTWYWIDVCAPTKEEYDTILGQKFQFHNKAIKSCQMEGQRPQVLFFKDYHFLVFNVINEVNDEAVEVNVFIGKNYLVTVHKHSNEVIDQVWLEVVNGVVEEEEEIGKGPLYLLHYILDQMVGSYFQPIYDIEDTLNEMDDYISVSTTKHSLKELFQIRSKLARLRRSLVPTRDVLYRLIHSRRFERFEKEENDREKHFQDIYEHVEKLVEMLEANRELVADIRDSYVSITSDFANDIMKKLTIISTIFMPLTFIVGVYGMNFKFMPELEWKPSYFIVLVVMANLAWWMYMWFKKKGWFDK
ncbi:magnesium/cobalt transporter CorA [Ectobacillus sp. JY-23]|uniref:magnesium/cobalt transporter CorA n=1 Tax=Ectobacillus sp. JY-23 TaxID=2933872 RepID=UPI001FF532A1|nr:magnesium/cobalt transporter CorA [Ectobacillus sp. JY-23]UOY93817.1 magnesium/cobalt transporter CorA [Ectobacillus sp. JY-23]